MSIEKYQQARRLIEETGGGDFEGAKPEALVVKAEKALSLTFPPILSVLEDLELLVFCARGFTADATLKRPLDNAGFQRVNAGLWNFRKSDDLNVVCLQKHSSESSFCVNVGVHYAFLPKSGTETPLTGDYVEQIDCEIKLRLTGVTTAGVIHQGLRRHNST